MCFSNFTTGAGGQRLAQRPDIPGGGILGQVQNVARLRTGFSGPSQTPAPQQQTQGGSLLGGATQGGSLLGGSAGSSLGAGVAARRKPSNLRERAQR